MKIDNKYKIRIKNRNEINKIFSIKINYYIINILKDKIIYPDLKDLKNTII